MRTIEFEFDNQTFTAVEVDGSLCWSEVTGALEQAERADREAMLAWLDSLWGRADLTDDADDEDVRGELRRQVIRDFRLSHSVAIAAGAER